VTGCAAAAVVVARFVGIGRRTGFRARNTALGVTADVDVGDEGYVRIGWCGCAIGPRRTEGC